MEQWARFGCEQGAHNALWIVLDFLKSWQTYIFCVQGVVVIIPSSFWVTWCYSHNFRVLRVIKVNPASFFGNLVL